MPSDKDYEALLTSLSKEVRAYPPADESVRAAAVRLDAMLESAVKNFEALDRKAILVPAAVAAVATFTSDQPVTLTVPSAILAGGAGVFGIAASILAIWAFSASRYRSGPDPLALARKTYRHPIAQTLADQGVVNSLAVAVKYCSELQDVKATRLNAALLAGAVGLIFLVLFMGVGGVLSMDPEDQIDPPATPATSEWTSDPWAEPSLQDLTGLQSSDGYVADEMGTAWSREAEGWDAEDMGSSSGATGEIGGELPDPAEA